MVTELKYSSQIKDMGLLSKEMKIACQEYKNTNDLGAIIQNSISNNIFMVNTERRQNSLLFTCRWTCFKHNKKCSWTC